MREYTDFLKMEVKECCNRPGVAQRVPGGLGSQIQGFQEVWDPRYNDIRHVKVVRSASRTGRLYPQECSWYSFSLGAESTPGPWNGRKDYVTEKSSDTTGNRCRDRSTSSAAP
jgi:hypothetical protein